MSGYILCQTQRPVPGENARDKPDSPGSDSSCCIARSIPLDGALRTSLVTRFELGATNLRFSGFRGAPLARDRSVPRRTVGCSCRLECAPDGVLLRNNGRRRVQDHRRRRDVGAGDRQVFRRDDRRASPSANRIRTSSTSAPANRRFAATSRTATEFSNRLTPERPGALSVSTDTRQIGRVRVHPKNPDIVVRRRPRPRLGSEHRARRVQDH